MSHLRRALGVLFAILIIALVVPRFMPTVSAIQPFGFYPKDSEGSAKTWANWPAKYAESVTCNSCHQEKYATWTKADHSGVSCETCHGPIGTHPAKTTTMVKDASREACGTCHSQTVGRPASFPQVDLSKHNTGVACVTCHNPHNPGLKSPAPATTLKPASAPASPSNTSPATTSAPAQIPAVPHALEGRADCLLCHNTGGMKPFPSNHAGRTSQTCLSCHKAK
ncbi:MAG: cytochrome c3 family protein [Dehalococcoidales bacterium]|nr:cytochrome c3 family protein [Dehalococcoidales bacterium]